MKRFFPLAGGFIAALFILALVTFSVYPQTYVIMQGEFRKVGLRVIASPAEAFTIQSAVVWTQDTDTFFSAQTSGIIQGAYVYADVDATNWSISSDYVLYWQVITDDGMIHIWSKEVTCGERWL